MKALFAIVLSLYVVLVCTIDPSLTLQSLEIELTNQLEGFTLSNIQVELMYGNVLNAPAASLILEYQWSIFVNFTTSCGQGSVDATISFLSKNEANTEEFNGSISFVVDPVSSEINWPVSDDYSFSIAEPLKENPAIGYQMTVIPQNSITRAEPNIPIHSQRKQSAEYSIVTPKYLNFTICNNLNTTATLQPGTHYWGIPSLSTIPTSIYSGDCQTFQLFARCNGGVLGASMSFEIDDKLPLQTVILDVAVSPSSASTHTTGEAACFSTAYHNPTPNCVCRLGPTGGSE